MNRFAQRSLLAVGALCAFVAAGCSSYTFVGRVIEGDVSYATIVADDDPQLSQGRGIGGVRVRVLTDPDRLNRKEVGNGVTSPDGAFSFGLDAFGAGFLEYDIGVDATRPGYAGIEEYFRMPKRGEAVLIVLAPGRDTRQPRENLTDEYNKYR
ncbi:MAG: hypothetical protein ACTS27_02620 [Phycisphaerales bacterium]